jgi:hypothetical protein
MCESEASRDGEEVMCVMRGAEARTGALSLVSIATTTMHQYTSGFSLNDLTSQYPYSPSREAADMSRLQSNLTDIVIATIMLTQFLSAYAWHPHPVHARNQIPLRQPLFLLINNSFFGFKARRGKNDEQLLVFTCHMPVAPAGSTAIHPLI